MMTLLALVFALLGSAHAQAAATGDDRLLRATPMLMTHDSGTGYTGSSDVRRTILTTQEFGFDKQLACGARFFDLRLIEYKGGAHFQHLSNDMPPQLGVFDQTIDSELPKFTKFGNEHPDDLVILYFSHCYKSIGTKLWLVTLPDTTIETKDCKQDFFINKVRSKNIYIVNDESSDGSILKTLTLGQAKAKAKAKGQPGVIAIFSSLVNENFDSKVSWFSGFSLSGLSLTKLVTMVNSLRGAKPNPNAWSSWDSYVQTSTTTSFEDNKLHYLQGFWQTIPVDTKNLNTAIAVTALALSDSKAGIALTDWWLEGHTRPTARARA